MITGHVRDDLPRVRLTVSTSWRTVPVEFVVDTGFDGELALPPHLLQDLSATFTWDRPILLADFSERIVAHCLARVEWLEDARETEIMALEGRPLLGNGLLRGTLLQVEMRDGGEVVIEPL